MEIKRIKKMRVNHHVFDVVWNKSHDNAEISYGDMTLEIGTNSGLENDIFMLLCHELMEIASIEMCVRMRRPDCATDYIFVYDHRQHHAMMNIFSGMLLQFIK